MKLEKRIRAIEVAADEANPATRCIRYNSLSAPGSTPTIHRRTAGSQLLGRRRGLRVDYRELLLIDEFV